MLFLVWESLWPAHSGTALRVLGLLRQISRAYKVEVVYLSRRPLTDEQVAVVGRHARQITWVPLRDQSVLDKSTALVKMLQLGYPYHSAVAHVSFGADPGALKQITSFSGVVYATLGHWGALVPKGQGRNWILDQQNADVDFWRVYASQALNPAIKLVALANWRVARRHFPPIYTRVGRVVSVCEPDRQLTLALAPQARVEVIENGVDCSFLVPERAPSLLPPRLLFTGTSAGRNLMALHQFLRNTWSILQAEVPGIELVVAGDFSERAQTEFRAYRNVRFTGRVDDMRPYFNQSQVFVAPFEEAYGSKLKIAEALAMGMPIVSTPQGVRGFLVRDGESVMIAHDWGQFAAHIVTLLREPDRSEHLGAAARALAVSRLDWRVLGDRLVSIVDQVQRESA